MRKGQPVEWDGDKYSKGYHSGIIEDASKNDCVVRWTHVEGKKLSTTYSFCFTRRKDGSWKPLGLRKSPPLVRM